MNFFKWLARLFLSKKTPESAKKKLLRRITRDIKKSEFAYFYNTQTKVLQPGFASYFYSIYMHAGPYANIVKGSHALSQAVIQYFLSSAQKEALQKISYDSIKEQSFKLSPKLLQIDFEKNILAVQKTFSQEWKDKVNAYYNLILKFSWVVSYDFYLMLHFFDSNLKPNDYFSKTFFGRIRSITVLEQIKDFLAIVYGLNIRSDWHIAFDILNRLSIKRIDIDNWQLLATAIERLIESGILENIIKHTEENPYWENVVLKSKESVTYKYITEVIETAQKNFQDIMQENKNEYIGEILQELYGKDAEKPAQCCYNSEMSEILENHGFAGFLHTDKINHLYHFLNSFFAGIKQLSDIFIIHGEWVRQEMSAALSGAMYELTSNYEALKVFYRDFDIEGRQKIKVDEYLKKTASKPLYRDFLAKLLFDINLEAAKITSRIIQSLQEIDKLFNTLNNESVGKNMGTIINWSTLEPILSKQEYNLAVCEKKMSDFFLLLNRNDGPQENSADGQKGRSPQPPPPL
ncbi:MAG: DUF5312 family protein [Spirochaetaceae bacterium]|jgi:hypothetical protein|nr:DUF5312 family protein [Spirochaetaceae bacterium]